VPSNSRRPDSSAGPPLPQRSLGPQPEVEKSGRSTNPGGLVQLIRDGRSVRSRAIQKGDEASCWSM